MNDIETERLRNHLTTIVRPRPSGSAELESLRGYVSESDDGLQFAEPKPWLFDDGAELNRPEPRISRRTRVVRPEELELANDPNRVELSAAESSRMSEDDLPEVTAGLQSAEFTTRVLPDAARRDERFGYDTQNYSWLQGIVEQGRNGTWHLVYSPTPDDADQFGGEVTLKRTAALNGIRHRAVIRVEGHFDSKERDRLGKPVYEVDPGSIESVARRSAS